MKRTVFLIAIMSIAGSGVAGAGRLEPFLARIAAGGLDKSTSPSPEVSTILAWDETEASRGRARVFIERERGADWGPLRAHLTALDPTLSWEGEIGDFAQVVVDFADLEPIASAPGVVYVARPPRGVPLIESQGLDSMHVHEFWHRGWTGANARVAVLDLGFQGYEELLGTELPRNVRVKSFYGSPAGNGDLSGGHEIHGTACAEIVHDIAPDAQLYLVNAQSPADLQAAVNWLIGEKVSVISHSVGWYWGGLNGTGPIDDIVETATRHGILWVNASGNEALRHTWTHAIDADGNGLIEFENDGGAERIYFSWDTTHNSITLALLWDSWPTSSDLDFTIDLVGPTGDILATSEPIASGYAAQVLTYSGSLSNPGVGARIRRVRGNMSGHILQLFRIGQGQYMYPCGITCPGTIAQQDRSLLAPADSRSVLTAGATDWQTGSIDSYTSHDSIAGKPEIYGPVGVSTRTYSPADFRGTSAAAPHVAGAAALLASAGIRGGLYDVLWTREDLMTLLRAAAMPLPNADIPLAWGIVRMPIEPPAAPERAGPRILGNPAWSAVRWIDGCDGVAIIDAAGRVIAHPRAADAWDGRDDAGSPAPAGIYWIRCPGGRASRFLWLGAPSGADGR